MYLNIDHFLQERQQAHDPEGYAIFKNVEAVLQDLSKSGFIKLDNLQSKQKIRNTTICILANQNNKTPFLDYGLIKQIVANHPKYDAIVNNAIKISREAQQSLSSLITHLKQEGITIFRVMAAARQ